MSNYRYADNYVATFKTVRDLNTTLRTDLVPKSGGVLTGPLFQDSETPSNQLATKDYVLPKTGGIVSGPIYQNTDASEMTQLATKQYVLDNVGTGGGGGSQSHPDKVESQDPAKSTSVLCTTDGVFFSDDSTTIAHLSKVATTAKLTSELDGLTLATNDLLVTNKAGTTTIADFTTSAVQVTAPVRYASESTVATLPNDIPPLSQVNSLIATAKQNVSQLIDANGDATTDNNYRLKVDNNQLEFARGATSEDTWLKFFGSTTGSSDGVVQQTNRSNFFFESEDTTGADVNAWIGHKADATPGSTYQNSALLRLTGGTTTDFATPYARVQATNVQVGAGNASANLVLYPKNSLTSSIVNKVNSNLRMGYTSTADLTQADGNSILSRSENDGRFMAITTKLNEIPAPTLSVSMNNQKITGLANGSADQDALNIITADGRYVGLGTPLNQITAPTGALSLNNQKITNLAQATQLTDAPNFNQLQATRQAYSTVRKTTTALTVNTKVTGFVLQEELNASQNCYWDNANQTFLVTTATNNDIRVKFTCTVKFNITATGNTATLVLRDFSGAGSNYTDTTMTCAQQNQTGTFERSFSVIKSFNTNRFVGLYCTAFNGGFSSLDITFMAETVFISTAINKLANTTNTSSISMGSGGLNVDQTAQSWFLNGATLYGVASQDSNTDFDVLTRKDFVDGRVDGLLLQQDGYRFAPSSVANGFAITKISNSTQPFVIQTDLGSASTVTVQNDLRLAYSGTKTLTDDSLMRRADVQTLINQGSQYPPYYMFRINIGDVPSGVESFQSTSNIISNVTFTLFADNNIGSYLIALSSYPFGNISADGYEVILSMRSLRSGQPSALDNDYYYPFVANRGNLSFEILLEQQFNVVQNVAIVGSIMKF